MRRAPLEFLGDYLIVGKNTDLAGKVHCFLNDFTGVQLGVLRQSPRGRKRVSHPGANRHDSIIRLDDIAIPADQVGDLLVSYDQQGFQMPQSAIGAPLLSQLNYSATQVAVKFLELLLKP